MQQQSAQYGSNRLRAFLSRFKARKGWVKVWIPLNHKRHEEEA
jgi:hypothetical protein